MRFVAIQPPYAFSPEQADASVEAIIRELDACDQTCDLILTPEYSNAPSAFTAETLAPFVRRHTPRLVEAARNAARRCGAIVALSLAAEGADGRLRNVTRLYGRDGEPVGEYAKRHLTAAEINVLKMDDGYTWDAAQAPEIVEVDGLRFGFLICYDTYFDEYVARLAAARPDVVLVSSFQRGERQDILRLQGQMTAFRCNAYVLRASLSMGADATAGGMSLVAAPDGRLLAEFGSRTGRLVCDVADPKWKHTRSNTYGGAPVRNDQFIEQGRRPWLYRPCGSMMVPGDAAMPYPRICAHRGFSSIAPENSLPAFGAAIAMGAPEIELDVRFTKDGVPVSIHDGHLDRVSNGTGDVSDHTLAELRTLDFSGKYANSLGGMTILTLDEVLRRFARHAVVNMHIKSVGFDSDQKRITTELYPEEYLGKILSLLDKYDCRQHVYFMGSMDVQRRALQMAPDIPRCMSAFPDPWEIVDRAIACKCSKVQLFKPHFDQKLIEHAHQNGIRVNVFWSDDPQEARQFLEMGADCILTNDYWNIAQALKAFLKKD